MSTLVLSCRLTKLGNISYTAVFLSGIYCIRYHRVHTIDNIKCVSLAPRMVYYQEIRTKFGFEAIRSHGCVRTTVHNYYHLVSVLKHHDFGNVDVLFFEKIIMKLKNVLFPM